MELCSHQDRGDHGRITEQDAPLALWYRRPHTNRGRGRPREPRLGLGRQDAQQRKIRTEAENFFQSLIYALNPVKQSGLLDI